MCSASDLAKVFRINTDVGQKEVHLLISDPPRLRGIMPQQ